MARTRGGEQKSKVSETNSPGYIKFIGPFRWFISWFTDDVTLILRLWTDLHVYCIKLINIDVAALAKDTWLCVMEGRARVTPVT